MISRRLALESALGDREVVILFRRLEYAPGEASPTSPPGALSSCTSRADAVVSHSTRCPAPVTYDQGTSRREPPRRLPERERDGARRSLWVLP